MKKSKNGSIDPKFTNKKFKCGEGKRSFFPISSVIRILIINKDETILYSKLPLHKYK